MSAKAIIVAAGRGRRLGGATDDIPKCMVAVAGRSILDWQLAALAAAGVTDVVIVRGYRGDRIAPSGGFAVRYVDNVEWERNNILASLMCAASEFDDGFTFSYADIVYRPEVARALAGAAPLVADGAALVVDRAWQASYQGRSEHPIEEAELARVVPSPRGPAVAEVGKCVVAPEAAAGEFIGLAYFSTGAAAALRRVWDDALRAGGPEAPFGRARTLRQAYLTDALNRMAADGVRFAPVWIDGAWREIDTGQDLAGAERWARTGA